MDEAKAAADAVAQPGDAALAGWLAVYQLAGIPVIGASVATGAASDRMGPEYWAVWMQVDDAHPGKGIPLDDLMQFLADTPGTDASLLGGKVLDDLRADAAATDPAAAFLADFVAEEESRRTSPVAILDPSVTADHVELDGATAQLLGWAVMRNMVAHFSAPSPTSGFTRPSTKLLGAPQAFRSSLQCNQLFGSEDATWWVNWFTNQMGSGAGITGLGAFPSVWNAISSFAPGLIGSDAASKATASAAKLNILTSVLTLLMQMKAITVSGYDDPSPLDRTNLASENAKTATSYFKLEVDPGALPDGNQKALCGLSFLLNSMGIQFQFPASGALSKVEVLVEPGQGFGQGASGGIVELPDMNDLKQVTDGNGQIAVLVRGVHQKHDIPATNPRIIKDYSLKLSATPGEVNGNNIFNTFFDGLTASDAVGAAKGALDVAQTVHWDLGEFTAQLNDWVAGYSFDQTVAGVYHISGQICDPSQPFHFPMDGNAGGAKNVGTVTVEGGEWTYSGSSSAIGRTLLLDATGAATVTTDPDTGLHVNIGQGNWTITAPIVGKAPYGPDGQHIGPFDLALTPLDECGSNS